MLNLSGIAKRYGGQVVLADVTWGVADGARVGLTGPNGAGQSALLRIIAGELEPDAGAVALPRGATVGDLPPDVLGPRRITVPGHALSGVAPTSCCSTSPRTTSTSRRATGSRSSSPPTRARSSWWRTTATSSTSRSTTSPRSCTAA